MPRLVIPRGKVLGHGLQIAHQRLDHRQFSPSPTRSRSDARGQPLPPVAQTLARGRTGEGNIEDIDEPLTEGIPGAHKRAVLHGCTDAAPPGHS